MVTYNETSRYYNCDTENGLVQDNLLIRDYDYNTTIVLANESSRLDLVSLRVYGTPVNWWLIARFNAIINPETAVAGTILKIPVLY